MNLLYFGTSERPLFGAYHAPRRRPIRPDGVVVCPPTGLDYMRTQRTLRRLAEALADAGHHVLRFDLYGTGDSGGDGEDASLEGWVGDVEVAIEELRAMTGVHTVSLVGVRLGGALACIAAERRSELDTLALWDPVARGSRYLESLKPRAREASAELAGRWTARTVEADGFPLPATLRAELAALDLSGIGPVHARRAVFLTSDPDDACTALAARLEALELGVIRVDRPDPGVWDDRGRLGRAVLAPELLREVPACLT